MENKAIKEEEEATNPYKYMLLDLIPNERRKWVMKSEDERFPLNESKLELRLGPPGGEEEESEAKKREGYNGNYSQAHNNPLSMAYFSSVTSCHWSYAKENSSQPCKSRMMELSNNDKKNKKFPSSSANTDVATNSHKRASCGAVVGWPPVRSSRRNLASSSSAKPVPTPSSAPPPPPPIKASEKPAGMSHKGLFVKINMEGVPIGRKVDLMAYDNYVKLCSSVDTLFRGLLAAQMDTPSCGVETKEEREKPISGLLDGSGEYTLVYEDHEGDRMLVGDVPWNMFVSTVRRLRVLKSSKLPSLTKVGDKGLVKQLKEE